MGRQLWGIDLGGTKIEGVVLKNGNDPQVLMRKRIGTEQEKGYQHILGRVRLLLDDMSKETGIKPTKVGIGTPGTLDPYTNTLKNSNTVCLNGAPFKQDLENLCGIPFQIANDANCFALAETKMGSVKAQMPEAKVVFGVIIGSGVGGGVVVNGEIINGRHGIGGEWGHNFLDEEAGECYCGKKGCVEKAISGRNLEAYFFNKTGRKEPLKTIYQNHMSGKDPDATFLINRLIRLFGLGISNVLNILDPDVVVLGGGVGNIPLLYTEGIMEIKKHLFNNRLDTLFLKPTLGDSAGVFGAAFLGLE